MAQTDFIECGGSGGVALWFEIASCLGLDVRAVGDLDCLFAPEIQRVMDQNPMACEGYRETLAGSPAKTSTVLRPLIEAMDRVKVRSDAKERSKWLATLSGGDGHRVRRDQILKIWADAGFWLHPQGTLEAVLGLSEKGISQARSAAATAGAIDAVANWAAYSLDPMGEIEPLLNAAVERIAHRIMEMLRLDPDADVVTRFSGPDEDQNRLVALESIGVGMYKVTVVAPPDFAGWWLNFSRETPSSQLVLKAPE